MAPAVYLLDHSCYLPPEECKVIVQEVEEYGKEWPVRVGRGGMAAGRDAGGAIHHVARKLTGATLPPPASCLPHAQHQIKLLHALVWPAQLKGPLRGLVTCTQQRLALACHTLRRCILTP